jgi:hypothetical protein
MADQAIQVASDQKLYLLFSHIYSNEDDLLINKLQARGWVLVRDERYTGARAVYLNQPRLSDRDDRSDDLVDRFLWSFPVDGSKDADLSVPRGAA